jgi:hypothetical protein
MRAQGIALPLLFLLVTGCQMTSAARVFELRSPDETGVRFANALREDDSLYNAIDFDYLYNGGGVAIADVNSDGLQDIYFAGNMVSSRLYLNRGHLHFDDVTNAAGAGTHVWVSGVTVVDINQDGLPDLYLSVGGPVPAQRGNLLFVNQGSDKNGTPRFLEEAQRFGIADTGYNTQGVFLDYDRDGDLDLYILKNALESSNRNRIRPKIIDGDAPSADRLYRNNGDGTFTNVSRQAGITAEGYGLGVAVTDLNRDDWPDVYAANDFLSNDLVWINNRDGTFTNRAAEYLKHQSFAAMGVDVADVNNDGLVDIMVLDMLPPDNLRRKLMFAGETYDQFEMSRRLGYQPEYVRNTLQLNNGPSPEGNPSFSEIGQLAGVDATDWSWAPLLADYDNDGWKDLVVTNGYPRDVTNLDYLAYLYGSRAYLPEHSGVDPERERRKRLLEWLRQLPRVKLSNYVFRNNGDLTFSDRTKAWGLDIASFSNGAAYADLDNDGDLDLVVNNLDGPAFVFENKAERLPSHNFLRFAFRGPPGNRDGYGAQVTLYAGQTRQYLEFNPSRGYLSTVEPFLHFGLGAVGSADSAVVGWPDGTRQLLLRVAANQVLTVDHRDARLWPASRPGAPDPRLLRAVTTSDGLAFRHEARVVPDFKATPLLPHTFSQGGPGLAVGDVDGDGREDVYVGTDRGHDKAVYLQTSPGRFARRVLPGGNDWQDMGALLFDADGDGDNDLLVASGGSFITTDPTIFQARLYMNDGHGRFTAGPDALPGISTSASGAAAADYDGDGDLDLFVGGRVIPGKYPLPPRSYLLRNDTRPGRGGPVRFSDVTDSAAAGLAHVGLVSSALWTDFDQDGKVDLIVVGEWMPITFFKNSGGWFVDVTRSTGLGATHGWWNSIVAGDFDHDGRTDYIVGNAGLNTRYRASEREPVHVYAADFDQNGTVDPVLSYHLQGKNYPVASWDLMVEQIKGMKGRFPRYSDYAQATLERTLSRAERERAHVARAVTFASAYLENLGSAKFALRPLPLPAQIAPIFGMLTGDYDGDDNLDVLLVGNSHAVDTETGWDDASIGAVLLGNGQRQFRYVSGASSGFYVDGDAKAVAELVLDETHSLVLVTQNDDSLKVFAQSRRGRTRNVRVGALDAYAVLTLADGTTRREELYYGSTYLSQSSRFLKVSEEVTRVTVYDSQGRSRDLVLKPGVPLAPARPRKADPSRLRRSG